MTKYLVGIGNFTQTDDSIGMRVVEHIANRGLNIPPHGDFEILDIADNGVNLLSYFTDDTESMVWVDCIRSGRAPGEFIVFTPEDVESQKRLSARTTHEGDMFQILELAKQLDYPIPPIQILGIEPESTRQGLELTPTVQARFEEYVAEALKLMK